MKKRREECMAPKTQKQLQSEQTQQRIIEAARQLFARKGFYGTSVADLAQATGMTKGALYHHFESKDALFFAVLEAARDTWREAIVRGVLKTKGALSRLAVLFDNHARLISEEETFCLVLTGLVLEMDGTNPAFMAALTRLFTDLSTFIERIIEKGQAAGEVRADLDPRLIALNIVGVLGGTATPWMLNRGEVDYTAMM
jgi:TetR/AcrR family transcriptional repressor of nem operon